MVEIPADLQSLSGPNASAGELAEQNANTIANRYAGEGWKDFSAINSELRWRRAQTYMALRWLRKESTIYVVESKISRQVAKVRITRVPVEEKLARQLSTDVTSLLAKIFINLKHSERDRHRLAYEVRTIAIRMAPYLDEQEFRSECKRYLARVQKHAKDGTSTGDEKEEVFANDAEILEFENSLDIPSRLETCETEDLAGWNPVPAKHPWLVIRSTSTLRICLLTVVVLTILYLWS